MISLDLKVRESQIILPDQGFLGRSTTGSGTAELLSPSQATDLLPAATASNDGKMTAAQADKLEQFSTESEYVRLGGRAGGQILYLGLNSGDDGVIHSNPSKNGLLKFGDNCVYDDGNRRLGVNQPNPTATGHFNSTTSDISSDGLTVGDALNSTLFNVRGDGAVNVSNKLSIGQLDTGSSLFYIDPATPLPLGSNQYSRNIVTSSGNNQAYNNLVYESRVSGNHDDIRSYGVLGTVAFLNNGDGGEIVSLSGTSSSQQNSSTNLSMTGVFGRTTTFSGNTETTKAFDALISNINGAIDTAYGYYIDFENTSGTINNGYGLYINNIEGANKWAIYDNSGADSYLSGTLTIGTHMYLNSPMYRDLQFSVNSLSSGTASNPDIGVLNSTLIDVALFDGGVTTEEVSGVIEIDHDYDEGTDIIPHIHWYPTDANTGNVKWQLEYVIVDVSGSGVVTGSTTTSVTTAATGTAWQLATSNFQAISGSSIEIGDQIHFKLFRDPSDAADTYSSDVAAATLGFHYLANSIGSSGTLTK